MGLLKQLCEGTIREVVPETVWTICGDLYQTKDLAVDSVRRLNPRNTWKTIEREGEVITSVFNGARWVKRITRGLKGR